MENDNNNNKKDNLNKENRNFKNQNNYYSNKDNKPHFYNTKYSGNSRRQNYNNNNHYNHHYNNYNHYYNKRQFEQKPNFINSSGKTFDNDKRGNYNDNKYDTSRIKKTYFGEGENSNDETKLKFVGKLKNPNTDDIKAPKRNYNEYNINNKYYDRKDKTEEEKENEPEKIIYRNSKKQINDESNENLKDLDTKGDLFLEKFKKISEQSNIVNTERKEPKRKYYNYIQKGSLNSIEDQLDKDDYIKDDNEYYHSYRKNNYKKKKNYYNNEYNNYNEYNDDEIINEITNPNQYEKKFEKVEEKKEMKIIKKKSEDKAEKKVEDLHEKVTISFKNDAKSLKDLLG